MSDIGSTDAPLSPLAEPMMAPNPRRLAMRIASAEDPAAVRCVRLGLQ